MGLSDLGMDDLGRPGPLRERLDICCFKLSKSVS